MRPVAVLHTVRMDRNAQDQVERVDEHVAIAADDLKFGNKQLSLRYFEIADIEGRR